jgi:hypothetical protein
MSDHEDNSKCDCASDDFNKYGAKLTDNEFCAQLGALYKDSSVKPTDWSNPEMNRLRTNTIINHTLGMEFPQEKRLALVDMQSETLRKEFIKVMYATDETRAAVTENFIEIASKKCNNAIEKQDLQHYFQV